MPELPENLKNGVVIVSEGFVKDCIKVKKLLAPEKYVVSTVSAGIRLR
jgi:hypothetical protein